MWPEYTKANWWPFQEKEQFSLLETFSYEHGGPIRKANQEREAT